MRVIYDRKTLVQEPLINPVATIGVFDGVHRGHVRLIEDLLARSQQVGGEAVVITFDSHPQTVLGVRPPAMLDSLDHRLLLLERLAVSAVVVLQFDRELAAIKASDFLRDIVRESLGCRYMVLGFDSNFGAGGRGTYSELIQENSHGVDLVQSDPLLVEGQPISSTRVRECILRGELQAAEELLGRPVSLFGSIIHGDGRGKALGFPTANLNLHHSAAPPHGVYIAKVQIEGSPYPALVNIGRRPTFMREDDPMGYSRYFNEQLDRIETYIHKFSGDLYGQQLEVVLVRKLRDEIRFSSKDALIEQIKKDVCALNSEF